MTAATFECPVARAARQRPEATAIELRGATVSYAQLEARVQEWQRRLAGDPARRPEGAPGRLFAAGVSSVETVALVHAAGRAGVALALLNPRLTAAETAALVASLQPATAADTLAPQPAARITTAIDPSAVQLLLFTSGTTGVPKAAQLTAGQLRHSALASNAVIGLGERSRFLCCLPLFHVGGLSIALRCAEAGAALVLHERFDAGAAARALESGVTHTSLVASTLSRTLDQVSRPPGALEHVRAALIGGGPVPPALLDRARAAGLPVLQTYGLTETCAQVTCERPGDADGTTAGPAMPGMELRIEDGEIQVRGPALMLGYLGQPEVPRDWFRTGDLGALDPRGRLQVFARRVDLILSGGENVYPAEIEAALLEHPAVLEAAVVPVADDRWGQVGRAFVALRNDCDLQAFLRGRLAGYKIPHQFVRVAALPRTAAGKVDRRALIRSLEPPGASPAAGAAAARGR